MSQKTKQTEKMYTAEEVAQAVLKKAQEMIKNHLAKANTSHEIEAGGEPSNDEAEAPEYLANADIENSGAHGEKKAKKAKSATPDQDGDGDVDGADAVAMADKDGDGDVDGDDAMEAAEESSGQDLDGDDEAGEAPEHKAKIDAAAKQKPADDSSKDDKIKAVAKAEALEKATIKEKGVHPPAVGRKSGSSNMGLHSNVESKKRISREVMEEARKMPKPNLPKSEDAAKCNDSRPSLKKFMLARKMKKAANADEQAAAKQAGAPAPESPAEKIKAAPKLEMEKNKPVEKLMGIAPKAGK